MLTKLQLLDEADVRDQCAELRTALGANAPATTGDPLMDLDSLTVAAVRFRVAARLPQKPVAQVPAGAMSETAKCLAARARASKATPPPTAAPLSRQDAERELASACSDYEQRSKAAYDARQIDQIAALAELMRAP